MPHRLTAASVLGLWFMLKSDVLGCLIRINNIRYYHSCRMACRCSVVVLYYHLCSKHIHNNENHTDVKEQESLLFPLIHGSLFHHHVLWKVRALYLTKQQIFIVPFMLVWFPCYAVVYLHKHITIWYISWAIMWASLITAWEGDFIITDDVSQQSFKYRHHKCKRRYQSFVIV